MNTQFLLRTTKEWKTLPSSVFFRKVQFRVIQIGVFSQMRNIVSHIVELGISVFSGHDTTKLTTVQVFEILPV